MKEIKKVRKICMVASGTFGIFSCMHASFSPISAALGLTYNEICELGFNFTNLEKEFQQNVEETLENLKQSLTHTNVEIVHEISEVSSSNYSLIVNELSEYIYAPSELKDYIEKSEEYQKKYCTQKDANEILEKFNRYFKINMVNKDELCRFYSLCNQEITINDLKLINKILQSADKNLKSINETLQSADKKITTIQDGIIVVENSVNTANKKINILLSKIKSFFNNLSYVLIQTGIFLIWSLLFFRETSVNTLIIVLISFTTTLFFSCFFSFNRFHSIIICLLVTWISKSLISIAIFLIISYITSNIDSTQCYLQLIGILFGELYMVLIRPFNRNMSHDVKLTED